MGWDPEGLKTPEEAGEGGLAARKEDLRWKTIIITIKDYFFEFETF
jgi:hypothetical protein